MGKLLEFKRPSSEQSVDTSLRSDLVQDYLLAMAATADAISVSKLVIERDFQVIKSIAQSTQNPELRDKLLRQMKAIQGQLLLVALDLFRQKRLMEKFNGALRESPVRQ